MKLTSDMEDKGFCLADVSMADLHDYLQVRRICYKKYIDEFSEVFGEWNDDIGVSTFYDTMNQTFFRKLLLNNESVGFLAFDQKEDRIDGISVQFIEKVRNIGIGSLYLSYIMTLSKELIKPIFLEVVKTNPAQNLYKRFGFEIYKETEAFYLMKYEPNRN